MGKVPSGELFCIWTGLVFLMSRFSHIITDKMGKSFKFWLIFVSSAFPIKCNKKIVISIRKHKLAVIVTVSNYSYRIYPAIRQGFWPSRMTSNT